MLDVGQRLMLKIKIIKDNKINTYLRIKDKFRYSLFPEISDHFRYSDCKYIIRIINSAHIKKLLTIFLIQA